jgi:hypothetical protein
LRDLLGVTGDFTQGFDPDEVPAGFASNLTATVSSSQLQQYQLSAEQAAAQAVSGAGLARLVSCASPTAASAACITQFLSSFGKRAFRRPLSTDEMARYQAVYDATSGGGATPDVAAGVQWTIAAMLQSPNFLYLPEIGDPTSPGQSGVALTPYEVATRLSYFLVETTPDDALLAAADAKQLSTPDEISTQAHRLLATPAARDAMVDFHRQWLEMTDVFSTDKNPTVYPMFTPTVLQEMNDEFAAFVLGTLVDGDGTLGSLLTADYSFIGPDLYAIYGLPAPPAGTPTTPTRATLPAGQRAGLMTLSSVLSVYGHTDQSAPVARGFLLVSKLLCEAPPPPPPGVDTNIPPPDPNVTTRQRLASHATNPVCAGCHGLMDPPGFTFEIYDGIGRYRAQDGVQPVDATATLPGIGAVHDAVDLMQHLAMSDQVRQCVVKQWFRYALGRPETADDGATLASAMSGFSGAGYRIPDLMVSLSTSDGFRYTKLAVPDSTPLSDDGGAPASAPPVGSSSSADAAAPMSMADAGADGGRNPNPNPNPCPPAATIKNYSLPGLSVSDFCDAYEKYCMYDPAGTSHAYCTAPVGPYFRDRADCEAQYMKASPTGQACRAGQLCHNAPAGLIVNACSHASGYCDPRCGL